MKTTFKSCMVIITLLICSSATHAQPQIINCPNLTASDVQSVIDEGTISTDQSYSLANEAGQTRAQVLINEPTANPFDTYYTLTAIKNINNQNYLIYIGNILGKAAYEAKDRAKMILLSDEKVFSGKHDPDSKICMYKEIQASPSISNYPFKSQYESVVLLAEPYDEQQDSIRNQMRKRHRS